MEVKQLLVVVVLLVQDSVVLAQQRRVTVMKGQTLHLHCPISSAHKTTVEWRNPKENIMFFSRIRALTDKRYRIDTLSMSKFKVSVSNVTFKDGGNYTCSQYAEHTIQRKVEVTVLGYPKITKAKHEGKVVIKCTAEANHHPPQISWKLDQGPEILADAQVHQEDAKYVSIAIFTLQLVKNSGTVKCLVRHPALRSPPLVDFVKIGHNPTNFHTSTMTSAPTSHPPTVAWRTPSRRSRHGETSTATVSETTREPPSRNTDKMTADPSSPPRSSSEAQTVTAPTGFPVNTVPSTDSHHSTPGWTSGGEITENTTTLFNSTDRNSTVGIHDPNVRRRSGGGATLLIFLVTCLIFCLLVVVLFFAIKLRRAHLTWKKENEESDPSEESSKSKSSQEEKNGKEQRRRGLFKTAFTQYVTEGPALATSNTGATTETHSESTGQRSEPPTSPRPVIKETEL